MDFDFQTALSNKTENSIFVRFYDRHIKTNDLDQRGLAKYKTVTFIEKRTRDDPSCYNQPARKDDILAFPLEYQRYQLQKKQMEDGTPLELFAFLDTSQIESCHYYGLFTLEALVALPQDKVEALNLVKEVEKAHVFLSLNKNNSAITAFEKKEEAYKTKIFNLEERLTALQKKIRSLEEKLKSTSEKD